MSEFPKNQKKKKRPVFFLFYTVFWGRSRAVFGGQARRRPPGSQPGGVLTARFWAAGQNTSRLATAGSTAAHRCRPCRQTPCQQAGNTAASATGAGVCAHRRHRKGPRPAIPQKTAGCAAGAGERAPLPPPCPTLPRHPASKTALCRAAHTGGTDRTPFSFFLAARCKSSRRATPSALRPGSDIICARSPSECRCRIFAGQPAAASPAPRRRAPRPRRRSA